MSDKKSLIAKIEEAILRHNKLYFMDSKENVDIFLNKMMNTPTKSPKVFLKVLTLMGCRFSLLETRMPKTLFCTCMAVLMLWR